MNGIWGCFHLVPAFKRQNLGVLSLSNTVRFQSRCSGSIELCLVSEETSLVLQNAGWARVREQGLFLAGSKQRCSLQPELEAA